MAPLVLTARAPAGVTSSATAPRSSQLRHSALRQLGSRRNVQCAFWWGKKKAEPVPEPESEFPVSDRSHFGSRKPAGVLERLVCHCSSLPRGRLSHLHCTEAL